MFVVVHVPSQICGRLWSMLNQYFLYKRSQAIPYFHHQNDQISHHIIQTRVTMDAREMARGSCHAGSFSKTEEHTL